MVAGLSVLARINGVSSSQLWIAVPLNDRNLSPTWKPACFPGGALSPGGHCRLADACDAGTTQSVTVETVVCATLVPYSMKRPAKRTNALATFTRGPEGLHSTHFP